MHASNGTEMTSFRASKSKQPLTKSAKKFTNECLEYRKNRWHFLFTKVNGCCAIRRYSRGSQKGCFLANYSGCIKDLRKGNFFCKKKIQVYWHCDHEIYQPFFQRQVSMPFWKCNAYLADTSLCSCLLAQSQQCGSRPKLAPTWEILEAVESDVVWSLFSGEENWIGERERRN